MKRSVVVMSAVVSLMVLGGCNSQKWSGTWSADEPGHAGELHCTVTPVDGGTWRGHFTGYCGRQFVYDVTMQGKSVGDRVVFDDETDLGAADGGTYRWTATIDGDAFTGKYTTESGKGGTFEMTRQ